MEINFDIGQFFLKESMRKIGEGKFREVHSIRDKEGNMRALKLIKPRIKATLGYFSFLVRPEVYSRLVLGIPDLNEYESQVYQEIHRTVPFDLADSFPQVYSTGNFHGRSASISDLVTNNDGEISKTLKENGPVNDRVFWEKIGAIENFLLDQDLPLFDISDTNLLVRKDARNIVPVVVDYKRYGNQNYPLQPWLRLKSKQDEKISRRFDRLREKYKT